MLPRRLVLLLVACTLLHACHGEDEALSTEQHAHLSRSLLQIQAQPRIVGGTAVAVNAYPYLAFTAGAKLCGATLIWPDILLSAGHCQNYFVDGVLISGVLLSGSDGSYHGVDRVHVHPNYPSDQGTEPSDIMLVKLSTSSNVQPVPLAPNPSLPAEGNSVKILGYGATVAGGYASSTAMQADVTVINFAACNNFYSTLNETLQFCSAANSGKDSCQGDSDI